MISFLPLSDMSVKNLAVARQRFALLTPYRRETDRKAMSKGNTVQLPAPKAHYLN